MNSGGLSRFRRVLVAGASGGIGQALLHALNSEPVEGRKLYGVSRSQMPDLPGVEWLPWNANQPELLGKRLAQADFCPDLVIACMGKLHQSERGPEKKLAEFDAGWCEELMWANCYSHLALASALQPLLKRDKELVWLSLSAMVGSIGDNHLGGWYSYRMSKAALNMAMKNLSIEWARRFPLSSVNLVHPGTTDTALSKPFQRNIPASRLYNSDQTAHRILQVAAQANSAETGSFYHWDGSKLPW